jgi:hypothetical protein
MHETVKATADITCAQLQIAWQECEADEVIIEAGTYGKVVGIIIGIELPLEVKWKDGREFYVSPNMVERAMNVQR